MGLKSFSAGVLQVFAPSLWYPHTPGNDAIGNGSGHTTNSKASRIILGIVWSLQRLLTGGHALARQELEAATLLVHIQNFIDRGDSAMIGTDLSLNAATV